MPDITQLIHTARRVNQSKPQHVVDRVVRLSSALAHPVIGCLGLTYKADVDDLRESPSVEVVRELKQRNVGDLLVCDPLLDEKRYSEHPLSSLDEVLDKAHAFGSVDGSSTVSKYPKGDFARKNPRRHTWCLAINSCRSFQASPI